VKTRRERTVVTAAVVAFAAVFAVLSLDFSWSAARFPLFASMLTIVMASLQLFADFRRPAPDGQLPEGSASASEVSALVWTAALVAGAYVMGLSIALPVFTGLYWRLMDKTSWRSAIAAGLSVLAFVQVLLGWLLRVDLYPGIIGRWQ
jgi:hypothetical protein